MKRAIYGAGIRGATLYRVISQYEDIDFFIDEYTDKKEWCGKKIYRLKDAPHARVYNAAFFYEDVVLPNLENRGFDTVSFYETLTLYPQIISEVAREKYLWLCDDKKLVSEQLDDVRKLFKEHQSIEIFDRIVKFRTTFDMTYYPSPNALLSEQYFPHDIPALVSEFDEIRFIDCGAFIGDTIELLHRHTTELEKRKIAISFEPDARNLRALHQHIKKFHDIETIVIPMGVYSSTKILKFSSSGSGSAICNEGDITVPVTSLDETVYTFQPNYIKMDVEGVEREVLLGAQHIIKDFTPNLAISLYHKPEDLWELPLLIHQLNPNYDFYLRVHAHLGIETILYCIGRSYD